MLVRNVHWSGAPWRSFASHPKAFDRPEHLLESWECAPAGTESKPKDDERWRAVRVEENGVVNLNALYPLSQQSVWVRTQITGRGCEENIHLMLGFSDQMTLWLNHQLVFEGQWLFNPPDEDGRVRVDSQRIPVRIGPGLDTILAKMFLQESYG
ncbi:MAG: hypothetical protein M1600_14025 [Firmicutes bacterium]|nr:hypothetical protein [Bacillota bacterium]